MRTTVTIDDVIYAAVRQRAIDSGLSLSAIIEHAIKYQIMEELEDLEDASSRFDEPTMTLSDFKKALKDEGLL